MEEAGSPDGSWREAAAAFFADFLLSFSVLALSSCQFQKQTGWSSRPPC